MASSRLWRLRRAAAAPRGACCVVVVMRGWGCGRLFRRSVVRSLLPVGPSVGVQQDGINIGTPIEKIGLWVACLPPTACMYVPGRRSGQGGLRWQQASFFGRRDWRTDETADDWGGLAACVGGVCGGWRESAVSCFGSIPFALRPSKGEGELIAALASSGQGTCTFLPLFPPFMISQPGAGRRRTLES